jgi:polyisoprenoid-binding protein YceI
MMHRLLLLAALAASPALAADSATGYAVDADRSSITFTGHSTFHDFSGTARVKQGSFTIAGDRASGSIEVDATSMDTKKAGRDKDMHAHMESATYPVIRFSVASVTKSERGLVARGTWTMHGVDKEMEVPIAITEGASPALTASFVVNFNDFKVTVPRNFGMKVDPKVDVRVELALKAADPEPVKPP